MQILRFLLPFYVCGLGLFLHSAECQVPQKPNPVAKPKNDSSRVQADQVLPGADLPVQNVSFAASEPVSGIAASVAIVMPVQCNSEGMTLVDMLAEPDFQSHQIHLLKFNSDRVQSVPVSVSQVQGLKNIDVQASFVSDSEVLVFAAATTGDGSKELVKPFLLLFGLDGVFKKLIKVPANYFIARAAVESTGDIVVFGYDSVNSVARLLLLDSNGENPTQIFVPKSFEAAGEREQKRLQVPSAPAVVSDAATGSMAFGGAQFTPFRDHVTLALPGSSSVLIIGPGRSLRPLEISTPKGYVLRGLVPSNDRLLAEFDVAPVAQARSTNEKTVYFEVNPSDGSLTRQLKIDSGSIGFIACEHDGTLLTFQNDQNKHLVPYRAEIGK